MRQIVGTAALAAMMACVEPSIVADHADVRPTRIVSLDYCADQFVLKLAAPESVLAVSPDADAGFSYMRETTEGVRQVRPLAEDVLALRPDLVVRSYGGGPNAAALFERAGVPVLQLGYAGTVEDIFAITEAAATGLGVPEAGTALNRETKTRLASYEGLINPGEALYITPGGVTSGPGTLIADLLTRAGLSTYETRPGWHALPLERLAHDKPDRVVAAFYGTANLSQTTWSAARHPIARAQIEDLPTTRLEGAWTACGAWFLVDAIAVLAEPPQ